MSAPPQARSNPSTVADEQAKVFQLKLAGWSHDRIAAELGVSHGTVANRLSAAIQERVGPLAEEYVDTREAELSDLYARSYRLAIDPRRPDDVRLKALNTCTRINESRRRLRGADAPQAMTLALEQRQDLESAVVADVLATVVPAIADAAGSDPGRRAQLERYGIELAQWILTGRQGEAPVCPAQRLAITAGSPSDGLAEPVPPRRPHDGADGVLAALAALEDEFPEAFEEDGDGPEDDQASVA